jgi:hypothetical protein
MMVALCSQNMQLLWICYKKSCVVTDYILIIKQKYRLCNHVFHDICNVQKFITHALTDVFM